MQSRPAASLSLHCIVRGVMWRRRIVIVHNHCADTTSYLLPYLAEVCWTGLHSWQELPVPFRSPVLFLPVVIVILTKVRHTRYCTALHCITI